LPSSFSPDGKRLALQRGNPFTAVEVWTAQVEATADHLRLGQGELFLRARGFPSRNARGVTENAALVHESEPVGLLYAADP
jgi:hypothetical protein